jgi:SAM-dependent methyltransferase
MDAIFGSARIAAGYARHRPAVHPQVVELIRSRVPHARRALDIGCGAGLSAAPLTLIADQVVGIEPAEAMLRWSSEVAPGAAFVAGRAEQLPIRGASIDLITAAGSLNYADLSLFAAEAVRVLRPGGTLVVYDFGPGREFRDSPVLGDWFGEFERRWPWPPARAIDVTRAPLNGPALRLVHRENFDIALPLAPEFYLEYVLTETNVEAAVNRGEAEAGIRSWCAETLAAAFAGAPRAVVFRGYVSYTRAR